MSQDRAVSESNPGDAVVDVTIERFVAGGKGLGHMPDGRVVLVDGGLPGDRLTIEVVKERPRLVEARLKHVIEGGVARTVPPCPEVERGCGGCDLQHAESSQQTGLKMAIVRDAIRRIAGIEGVEIDPGPVLAPFGYRTTLRCGVDPTTGRLGFRERRSHRTHVVDDCLVAHPHAAGVIRDARFPGHREVTVRVSVATGERMVVVAGEPGDFVVPDGVTVVPVGADHRGRGGRGGPGGRRGRQGRGGRGGRGPVTTTARTTPTGELDDDHYIHEVVADQRFRISPGSFFQARPDGAAALVGAVGRALGDFDPLTSRLVDLYGGVGLFTAGLDARDGELVERSSSATADAAVNLAALGTTIRTMDVGEWSPTPADAVVADPSRTGLGRDGVEAIVATGAATLALVSCDPASMARDMRTLVDAGYQPIASELVDMFPQTHHIEAVTGFRRK